MMGDALVGVALVALVGDALVGVVVALQLYDLI